MEREKTVLHTNARIEAAATNGQALFSRSFLSLSVAVLCYRVIAAPFMLPSTPSTSSPSTSSTIAIDIVHIFVFGLFFLSVFRLGSFIVVGVGSV